MANRLSMAKINAIQTLHDSGHSNRKIAKLLNIDRGSVGKYVQQLQNQPNAPTGVEADSSHRPGPPSACEPYREVIRGLLEEGLSAQRIFQDLKREQDNALKGCEFRSLADQNDHLLEWETSIADTRIHGTTKQQVRKRFEEVERPALLPLPRDGFPAFHEGRRSVHRDGYVEVGKAYYSAPPECIGRRIWVRWDSRTVRLFNDQWQQLAVHAKAEPGRFRTAAQHVPREKVSAVERGADDLLRQIALIGPFTKQWSEATMQVRGVEAVRVLVGLKALAGKHSIASLERACEVALAHGVHRLRTIRQLLKRDSNRQQQQFDFLEEHPIIRPLSDYSLASLTEFRKERPHERESS